MRKKDKHVLRLIKKRQKAKLRRMKSRGKSENVMEKVPSYLRGAAHQHMSNLRGLRGQTFGAAGPCKRIDPDTGEIIAIMKPR